MASGNLYALDFDGVLCDSCGESSLSALKWLYKERFARILKDPLINPDRIKQIGRREMRAVDSPARERSPIPTPIAPDELSNTRSYCLKKPITAAKIRWPSLFGEVDHAMEEWIIDQMHILRPVVETGYENLLLVRLLVELKIPSVRKSSVAEGLTVETILKSWPKLKPTIMSEWSEDKDSLIDLFGKVRDEWMENDLTSWMGANRFYPGVADALSFSSSEVYIVTTKQSRFAEALLRELAGINFPSERIYGLGTGPKVEVLKKLQAMPQHLGMTLHFVEDRLATLKNVIKEPALNQWNLYLGTWGYNTAKEREEAREISRIQLVDISEFGKNLK